MIFKSLPVEQWDELRPFLASFGQYGLPVKHMKIGVVRDDGLIVGMIVSETVTHVGPTYVLPEYLGGMAGAMLIRHALNENRGMDIHVLAMNEATERICERLKLERYEGCLYVKVAD